MPDENPAFGEKTLAYPFGYGWCQCGCNKITQMTPDLIWASYLDGHEPKRGDNPDLPIPNERNQSDRNSSPASAKKYFYPQQGLLEAFLDLHAKHNLISCEVAQSKLTIRIVLKIMHDFWRGEADAKDLAIDKLEQVLARLRPLSQTGTKKIGEP